MPQFRALSVGDPAPWFHQRSTSNPRYAFDTVGGRYIVLCFFGSTSDPGAHAMLDIVSERRDLFDDEKVAFFGVSIDPQDEQSGRVKEVTPGIRFFWDFDTSISRLYGAVPEDAEGGAVSFRRFWVVLDPMMRVRALFAARPDGGDRHEVAGYLAALPPVQDFAGQPVSAPIILLPNVFEPQVCDHLVGLYEQHGGEESGFMREVDGKTVAVVDAGHKRRADYGIDDERLKGELRRRILRRVVPEIRKVHQFEVTRMERYIVSCYDSATGGHFRAHRDNTTKGTAHRRFALSINLNDAFTGGEVGFPEYGPRTYKPPKGGAVVFSCSLLHNVSPVRSGRRFAFLPFLYDDAAAELREKNNQYLDAGVARYKG